MPEPLTDDERAILAFEGEWLRHAGAKEQAIRSDLGLAPARYYQLLGRLIDSPAALAHDPMLVRRLRRLRDQQERTRRARERALPAEFRG
ncbi:MAG: DUF3263 domain-containing protein [Microbacterium sp.]|jgi:hypothetical protein|uniref:DUF3263 domain-containing protein n=1 Tax=Microbacterium sp. TaxID=51671 RepID=UPI000DAF9E3E|nr:DUF3263 domain-containing protein [Microbacterium sp.]PZU36694.1 MAG: DUF3263 domain-containing protein [Microbacterium sp.]